jgi:UDP:flavonoid glycosyltransferase YjiC (YdhE family)
MHKKINLKALYAGVPLICIPFFGDQHYNAAVVEYSGTGIWLDHIGFDQHVLHAAIDKVLAPGY